ncbi:MAG: GAF domain-containing protein [Ktedonobacteraceae bacterium]
MEAKTHTPTLKESTIVERVARIVSSVRGTKPDYTHLAAELEPAIPFDVFGVVLLRHDRQAVRVTVCQKENGFWLAQRHQHPLEGSMVEQVLRSPMTVVENYPDGVDGPPAKCGDALSGWHHLRATLIAPLIVGDLVLGTLELGSTILDAYTDKTLQRLIEAVVRVLAAAIESAQVGGSAEIQDRQRQALKDVSSALTSKMDLSSILNQIVDGIAQALNVASAIVIFDQRGGRLRLEAQSGLEPAKLRGIVGGREALTDQSIIGYTLRRHQPCVSHDISTDERFPGSRSFTAELGIRSIFSYPLVTGTTVYGALFLFSPEPGGFTPLKADILSLFASQATVAIHNGMLIESAHQRSRFQHAIEQLERAYEQNLDEQELLVRVRQESERTFGVSFSSLLHFVSDHLLTRNERDLHAILYAGQQEYHEEEAMPFLSETSPAVAVTSPAVAVTGQQIPYSQEQPLNGHDEEEGTVHPLVLLTQTAEAALARAEVLSELSRLFTQLKQSSVHIKDALFVVDLHGLCIYMSPAAEVFCGMHRGTVSESTLEDIFTELLPRIRNADEVHAYLHDFILGNVYRQDLHCVLAVEPVHAAQSPDVGAGSLAEPSLEDRYTLSGGQLPRRASRSSLLMDSVPSDQHYRLTRYPLLNQQGTLIANVLQVHDITAQVRDEKNKSALLSSVSHDLRTPLTTIKAAVTGLLQADVEWDEQIRREILEEIDAEADHLGVLVNALIEMSRIEMGALVLDKEWCDIVEVVHGVLLRLERALAGRPIRSQFQAQLPLIYADHVQVERVFYNLIEHALRHSSGNAEMLVAVDTVDVWAGTQVDTLPVGEVAGTREESLTVTRPADAPDVPLRYLRVKIIDYGCEVSADERERVFRTFYGLNAHGSGLGLAISRGIVEAHQGQIGVEAAPDGDGLCFVFTLPLLQFIASATEESSTDMHS